MTTKLLTTSSLVKNSLVTVEIDLNNHGLPSFEIVGLGDKTVEESKSRVRSSIVNSGFSFPMHHLTVNLTPADSKKEGSHFDLAIQVGILIASSQINSNQYSDWLFYGETYLDGQITLSKNILPELLIAQKLGYQNVFLPLSFKKELEKSFLRLNVIFIDSLQTVCRIFSGLEQPFIESLDPNTSRLVPLESNDLDFKYVRGQVMAKRALEIAAAGRHNILFYGPPGTGKTLLAKTFPTILPNLSENKAKEVYSIFVDAGLEGKRQDYFTPPFRSPHHSASLVGIVGGGPKVKPGELSLAHNGVLFLDEMAEFPRSILESIRQPLEDQEILISRSGNKITFPSDFILLGSTNPCPCGYFRNPLKNCTCTFSQLDKYRKKLSGPILDRIDMFVPVSDLPPSMLVTSKNEESSEQIKQRVIKSIKFGKQRSSGNFIYNSRLPNRDLIKNINFNNSDLEYFIQIVEKLNLSPRSVCKVLKVARTIADLDESILVERKHFTESLAYKLNLPNIN